MAFKPVATKPTIGKVGELPPPVDRPCLWPNCSKQRPDGWMWGCEQHWFMLPEELRDAVFSAYLPSREDNPTEEWQVIMKAIQEWIASEHPVSVVTDKPVCIACGGTKISSSGHPCVPCLPF